MLNLQNVETIFEIQFEAYFCFEKVYVIPQGSHMNGSPGLVMHIHLDMAF